MRITMGVMIEKMRLNSNFRVNSYLAIIRSVVSCLTGNSTTNKSHILARAIVASTLLTTSVTNLSAQPTNQAVMDYSGIHSEWQKSRIDRTTSSPSGSALIAPESSVLRRDRSQMELYGTDETATANNQLHAVVNPYPRLTDTEEAMAYLNDDATADLITSTLSTTTGIRALNIIYNDAANLAVSKGLIMDSLSKGIKSRTSAMTDAIQASTSGIAPIVLQQIYYCIAQKMKLHAMSYDHANSECEKAVEIQTALSARGGWDGQCESLAQIVSTGSDKIKGYILSLIGDKRYCPSPIGASGSDPGVFAMRPDGVPPTASASQSWREIYNTTLGLLNSSMTTSTCNTNEDSCIETIKTNLQSVANAFPMLTPLTVHFNLIADGYFDTSAAQRNEYLAMRNATNTMHSMCGVVKLALSKGAAMNLSLDEQNVMQSRYQASCGPIEQMSKDYDVSHQHLSDYEKFIRPGVRGELSNSMAWAHDSKRQSNDPGGIFLPGHGITRKDPS